MSYLKVQNKPFYYTKELAYFQYKKSKLWQVLAM